MTNDKSRITATFYVEAIQRHWPETITVFRQHAVMCIGCPLAAFCTVEDAATAHHLVLNDFLQQLNDACNQTNDTPSPTR